MTISNRPSLRKCINKHCRCCIYDRAAAGTWKQQVTLCSVTGCPLYPVRPVTESAIPDSVLDYYQRPDSEGAQYACSRPQEGPFSVRSGES